MSFESITEAAGLAHGSLLQRQMNFNFQEGHNGEKVARARQCSVVALYMIVALTGWQSKLPKPPYLWAKQKCVDLNN